MVSIYLLWCLCYAILHLRLSEKWPLKSPSHPLPIFEGQISLIIPFRNEKHNLYKLADELKKTVRANVEILLVDDQSEDGSFGLLSNLLAENKNIFLLKSSGIGKKAALDFGISQSRGQLIVTSDADCDFPENWLEKMAGSFGSPAVQLVAGPVVSKVNDPAFLQRFQQIDWFSILLLTQFSFRRKQPLMCSGANLAFRKSAFLAVGGYAGNEHLLSGDDEFLLKKILSKFGGGSCVYLPFRENLVITSPESSWKDLLSQRIRWAGKWKAHRSFSHSASALIALVFQLVWLSVFFVIGKNWEGLGLLILLWAVKIIAEKGSLGKVGASLGIGLGWSDFILSGVIHPFYVIFVGIGTVFLKVKWKGRSQ
jgi:poly-beta-1,6-N-acetyl-D-glucosamine synthase